jgi:PKD repeat protein
VNGAEFGTGETLTVSADVGTYTVTLTVEDDEGATGTDDVIITVAPTDANLPPVADAGPNQSVRDANDSGSEAVTLDGSGSADLDGTIASWSWSVDGAEIGTGETLTTDFNVGTHDVTLTVTDDESATGTDDVRITVVAQAGNLPPIADAGPDQTVVDHDGDGSALVTVDGSGSTDPDGFITDYLWGPPIGGGGETIGANLDVGVHTVTLTVTDNDSATDTDEVEITVREPTITGVAIYQRPDFDGAGKLLRGDTPVLGDLPGPCPFGGSWDDCISSIKLSPGWSATLFELDDFEGDSLVVETDIEDLGDIGIGLWDNRASSIEIRPPN